MKCEVCQREFHSPFPDLVCICSCCIARGADFLNGVLPSNELGDFVGEDELEELFPDFELGERLGAGGMGIVFRARQKVLNRSVAIKILNSKGLGDPEYEERFEREANAMALLNHPNIVGIHDFGVRGPYHFFIMEWVDGMDLRQLIRSGKLATESAFSIIRQICAGLHHAHQNGVVHRDLKPENILVGQDGVAKISDFGLARIKRGKGDVDLTMMNAGIGTPAYMAPEQRADASSTDLSCDIFALGVVCYEMLTGSIPVGNFPAPTSGLRCRNRRLDKTILRAMDPDPEKRLSDPREISDIIASSKLSESSAPVRALLDSSPVVVGTCLVVAILILVAGYGFWSSRQMSERAEMFTPDPGESDLVEALPLDPFLPRAAFPFDPDFERVRRLGGVFRQWTSSGAPLPQVPNSDIEDLVSLQRLRWVRGWMGARSDGTNVSNFNPLNKMRGVIHSTGYFHLKWDQKCLHWPPHSALKVLDTVPKQAVDAAQTSDFAVLVTPERKVVLVTASRWRPLVSQLEKRLENVNDVVSVKGWGFMFAVLRESGEVIAWHLEQGMLPDHQGSFRQIAVGACHVVGLDRDQRLSAWSNARFGGFDHVKRSLQVPEGENQIVRIKSLASVNAAQRADGSWIGWGNDDSGLIEKIHSLGPVPDLMLFEPSRGAASSLAWIEPHPSETNEEERSSPPSSKE